MVSNDSFNVEGMVASVFLLDFLLKGGARLFCGEVYGEKLGHSAK